MYFLIFLTSIILFDIHLTTAFPFRFQLSPYAPTQAPCPAGPLVRPAQGISNGEVQYIQQRKVGTTESLRDFFLNLNTNRPANDSFPALDATMPVMAFASSGGGVRATLAGAGVVQAFDRRDPASGLSPLSGLWQSMCYHSGLSGGSWLVGALAGNDKATVSALTTDLWISSFSDPSFLPYGKQGPDTYARLFLDILTKIWAGFPTTLVDAWGRLVSLHTLMGDESGVGITMSGIVNKSDFQTFQMPFPIITTLAVDPVGGVNECIFAGPASPQYEFHPYEFGSWDPAIRSFALTNYMGTTTNRGIPLSQSTCVTGFDSLSFIMGSSSNLLNYFCGEVPQPNLLSGQLGEVQSNLIRMTSMAKSLSFMDEYGVIPNEMVDSSSGQAMTGSDNLYLVDGGEGSENLPLWPMIQPERGIDIIWANDNSADTATNWPNGSALHWTYMRARRAGLTTMPVIPTPDEIVAQNPDRLPMVFGCYDITKITIIWLPNTEYSFGSNIPTWILLYTSTQVQSMIQNSNQVATLGGDPNWPTCLGCVILNRSNRNGNSVSECSSCFERFCWKG